MLKGIIDAIGQQVTRRTSVFTPVLVLNFIIDGFSFLIYLRSNSLAVFIPAVLLLIYSVYRHEKFSMDMPWMLSATTIQRYGMKLAAGMGQKDNVMSEDTLEELPAMTPEEGVILDTQIEKKKQK